MGRAVLAVAGAVLLAVMAGGCGGAAPAAGPRQVNATTAATAGGTTAATTGAGTTAATAGEGTATFSATGAATPSASTPPETAASSPAAGAPRPAAPSPASLPAALGGVEAARFASPVAQVSSGPSLGDVAVVTQNNNLHIFLGGAAQPVVPLAGEAAWVPGSDWVIASRLSPPTIQGSTVLGYRALLAGGRAAPLALPPCTQGPPQGLPGPAVALVCGHTLEVAKLAAGGLTDVRPYPWTAQIGAASFTVNPDATLAAALMAGSCYVRVFALASGTPWPGTYMAARPNCPDALAWSGGGTLAIAAFPGVTVWSAGHVATLAKEGDFHTMLWTAAGLLVISSTPFHPPWADIVAPDGTARAVAVPSGPVVGLTAGGRYAWLAVSFSGTPATYGIAATGA